MPNDKQFRSHCTSCRRPRLEGERFSARGRCYACGRGRMEQNAAELAAQRGPYFDRWRRACAAAFGALALDDRRGGE